jgi:hypothetical protein
MIRDRDVVGLLALALYCVALVAALRNTSSTPEPDPPSTACPHCGGGPVVELPGGARACRSCTRVVTKRPVEGDTR